MAAVTTDAPLQHGQESLTLHPHRPTPPVSSPPPVSPPRQHQPPIHQNRSPIPLHAPPDLVSACSPVLDQSAGHRTFTHQQPTGSVHQEPAVQQASLASAQDDPSNSASSVFSQQGLSPGAATDQGLHATVTDSPVSVPTELSPDVATADASAEAEEHAPGHGPGTGRLVTQTTKSQANADKFPLSAEQKCQAPLSGTVISDTDETDAQQLLASGFETGTGRQVTVIAHGKTRATDMIGCSTPAQTDPKHLPEVTVHAPSAAKGRSPGYEAPAAVASGFTTGAGKPVNVTTRGQAEARKLFDTAAPQDFGRSAAEPMPADRVTVVASGFTTGTGKAVLTSAAGQARAAQMLADDSTADQQPTAAASESSSAAAPTNALSGFSTGTGKAVIMSAAAMARAQKVLADDSMATEQPTESASEPPSTAAFAHSGFSTGTGKAVQFSAAAMARADDSSAEQPTGFASEPPSAAAPAVAPSGFSTGTGKAVLTSAAAMARAQKVLADDNTAAEQTTGLASDPPITAAPAIAPSGFNTGTGKAVLTSAAAMAQAKKVLADDNIAPEETKGLASEPPGGAAPAVAPSGFSTGTGKAVQFSAAAKARAEMLFADDSTAGEHLTGAASEPASAAAPTPAPSGFTSGAGKAVPISAAAQALARSMFQDENAAPLHPGADMDCSSTPAGSNSSRPGMKTASARPVLGNPRTGPPVSKPVMKRVKELSQSTGGKLFKKPRMSKIVSPFCPGATRHRVGLDCGLISQQAAMLCCMSTYHRLHLSDFVAFVDCTCDQVKILVKGSIVINKHYMSYCC